MFSEYILQTTNNMYERLWQHHWHCFILSMRVSPLFPAKTERVNAHYDMNPMLSSPVSRGPPPAPAPAPGCPS